MKHLAIDSLRSKKEIILEEIHFSPLANTEKFCLVTFSAIIEPINNFNKLFKKIKKCMGNTFCLNPLHRWQDERRKIDSDLRLAVGSKRIYLIAHDTFDLNQEEVRLNKFGLTHCKNSANYLLGLISVIPEKRMPPSTKNKAILAYEQLFRGHYTDNACLGIKRHQNDRGFDLFEKDSIYLMEKFEWMILAEKI